MCVRSLHAAAAQLLRHRDGRAACDSSSSMLRIEWLQGKVLRRTLRRNNDTRRRMDDGTVANFVVAFDMDGGSTTAMLLEAEDYSTQPDAQAGAWFLVAPAEGSSCYGSGCCRGHGGGRRQGTCHRCWRTLRRHRDDRRHR